MGTGVRIAAFAQIVTAVVLGLVIYVSETLEPGMLVLSLVLVWLAIIAANNTFTTYFNSISQQRLEANERGRYISNIITIFTLGNAAGTLLFGWATSTAGGAVSSSLCL